MRTIRAAILAFVITAVPCAAAAAATTPIALPLVCAGGTAAANIVAPGSYRVSNAVANCNTTFAGIVIYSSDVTLDLGNNVIDGQDSGGTSGILVSSGLANVTIENGTVRDWGAGVSLRGVRDSRVTSVIARSNGDGIISGATSTIDSNVVAANTAIGIDDTGGSNRITHNIVTNNANGGIGLTGSNTVDHNTVVGNPNAGIGATQASNVISDNTIDGNGAQGVLSGDSQTITGNTVIGNGTTGIFTAQSSVVAKNNVIGNVQHGIATGSFTTISSNVVRANGSDGINTSDNVVVTSNRVLGNDANGITVGTGSTFHGTITKNNSSGNRVGLNVVGAFDPSATVSKNTFDGNVLSGETETGAGPAPKGVHTNEAHGNGVQCDLNLCTSAKVAHPITIDCSQSIGKLISKAGSYALAQTTGGICNTPATLIEVDASNVQLNLGSIAMTGHPGTCNFGVLVKGSNVIVTGGVISDCGAGIATQGKHGKVRGTVLKHGGNGYFATNFPGNDVSSLIVRDESLQGIAGGGAVTSSVAVACATGLDNFLKPASGDTVVGSSANGISTANGSVTKSLAFANAGRGINLFNSTVSSSTAIGNGQDGILANDIGNTLSKNISIGNGSRGIEVVDGNTVSGNTTKANAQAGILGADKETVSGNTSEGNGGPGIRLNPSGSTLDHTTISGNTTDGNNADGIELTKQTDSPTTTTVTKNHADGNAEQGIDTAPGFQPLGTQTNEGSGNVLFPQCDGNLCP